MTATDMVELIEEMIEIKVRQHAAQDAKTQNLKTANRELARAIYQATYADRERLQSVKQALVQILESA